MATRWRWLGGHPAYDLSFFVGSGLLCFAFWAAYEALAPGGWLPSGLVLLLTYLVFTALLDLPHIFQTFSRTHGDAEERRRRPWLYFLGLPLLMASGLLIPWLGLDGPFVAFMALYGSHHIVRQHVGLMRAYQVLNEGGSQAFDQRLDRLAFELALYACVVQAYAAEAGGHTKQVAVYGGLVATFPVLPPVVPQVLGWAALAVGAWWLARQAQRALDGQAVNLPKLLLMAMALSTHVVVFLVASVPFLVAEAIETAYHDVQYHAWVHRFQRLRFGARAALLWALGALAYGLVAGCLELLALVDERYVWLFAPLGMLTLFHYWIDGRIWRMRDDPALRALMLGPSAAASAGAQPTAS